MLASQIANRRAVSRASGHVPETLHNIRTIHCLQKETYMEQQYAHYIDDSYSAMEKTNFYDAVYSPVILILNAIVVAVVMLLSASGNPTVLKLFGMSAQKLAAFLRDAKGTPHHWLFKGFDGANIPYQPIIDRGLMKVKHRTSSLNGMPCTQGYFTPKGIEALRKLLKA